MCLIRLSGCNKPNIHENIESRWNFNIIYSLAESECATFLPHASTTSQRIANRTRETPRAADPEVSRTTSLAPFDPDFLLCREQRGSTRSLNCLRPAQSLHRWVFCEKASFRISASRQRYVDTVCLLADFMEIGFYRSATVRSIYFIWILTKANGFVISLHRDWIFLSPFKVVSGCVQFHIQNIMFVVNNINYTFRIPLLLLPVSASNIFAHSTPCSCFDYVVIADIIN